MRTFLLSTLSLALLASCREAESQGALDGFARMAGHGFGAGEANDDAAGTGDHEADVIGVRGFR